MTNTGYNYVSTPTKLEGHWIGQSCLDIYNVGEIWVGVWGCSHIHVSMALQRQLWVHGRGSSHV